MKDGSRDCSGNEEPERMNRGLETFPLITQNSWPCAFVRAAITEHQRLGGLNDIYFSQFERL